MLNGWQWLLLCGTGATIGAHLIMRRVATRIRLAPPGHRPAIYWKSMRRFQRAVVWIFAAAVVPTVVFDSLETSWWVGALILLPMIFLLSYATFWPDREARGAKWSFLAFAGFRLRLEGAAALTLILPGVVAHFVVGGRAVAAAVSLVGGFAYLWAYDLVHAFVWRCRPVGGATARVVSRLAGRAGVRLSRVYRSDLVDSRYALAWACGILPRRLSVIYSKRLEQALPPRQVEAIAAHEIAHLALGHVWREVLLYWGIVAAFVTLVELPVFSSFYFTVGTACAVAWVGFRFYRAYRRKHEREADQLAARLIGGPGHLMKGLIRLHELHALPSSFSKRDARAMTHPALEKRLGYLRSLPKGRPLRPVPAA